MNANNRLVMAFAFLAFALPLQASAQDPADLRDCLEKIQRQGMSEGAATQLGGIAGIRLGHSSLTFVSTDDSGHYYASFRSNICPVPGTHPDTLAVRQQAMNAARDAETALLKPLADSDGSGFVSSPEAWDFRTVFEFGTLIDQLRQDADYTAEKARLAAGLDAETFARRWQSYGDLQRRAAASGVSGFPELVAP